MCKIQIVVLKKFVIWCTILLSNYIEIYCIIISSQHAIKSNALLRFNRYLRVLWQRCYVQVNLN